MSLTSPFISFGCPVFPESQTPPGEGGEGVEQSWRQLLSAGGSQSFSKVGGAFAVGLREADGSALLAVDRFAIESLCYRVIDGEIHFARRADDLVLGKGEIDPQAIFDYFYFHVIPSPRTIFRDVYRVPPGHYVSFQKGEVTVAPYWVPNFTESSESFDAQRTTFLELLEQAVGRQLDGGKAGCFLSGGTDSSTVAGMIGRVQGKSASTYSIGFEAEGYDEMEFARIAAKHFGTEHHEYYVTPQDLIDSIPLVAASYDQPFGNSSALPAYYCARMAREDGVTRILAGDGGDELFGGNSRYARQKVFERYQYVPQLLRKYLLEPALAGQGGSSFTLLRKAASYIEQASAPMPDRLQMYNLIMRLGPEHALAPELLSHVRQDLPLDHQRSVWQGANARNILDRELAFDWRYTLGEIDLPKVTGTTRLAGIGVGFPMLDGALVDFSTQLPQDYKVKGQQLRWFFKEALRGFLPDEIITKKKQGFGLPFGVWLTRNPGLLALASESLNGLVYRNVLRADFVTDLINRRLPEHPGYFGEMIWISLMLEQWMRKYAPEFRL